MILAYILVTIYMLTEDSYLSTYKKVSVENFNGNLDFYIKPPHLWNSKEVHVLPSHVFNSANQVLDLFAPLF